MSDAPVAILMRDQAKAQESARQLAGIPAVRHLTRRESTGVAGHVLLVEDNSINRMFVAEALAQIGCTCDAVCNGREAVEAVQQRCYQLVLMDCQLPEMDGFEATRLIRQLESQGNLRGRLPIVALTANAVKGDQERCTDAGLDDYFSKPVQMQQIASMLDKYMRAGRPNETLPKGATVDAPSSLPIDAEHLLERLFGDREFTNSMLDEWEASGQDRVDRIASYADRRDAAGTAREAHSLKGTAGLFCAHAIEDLARRIEEASASENLDQLEGLVHELSTEMLHCLDSMPLLRKRLSLPEVPKMKPREA